MAVTLHDVARAADVSIKTVSNVINDYPHVRPATRERVQAYEGVVIATKNGGLNSSFTVRKISHGYGVERVFQTHSAIIDSVEVKRRGKVRAGKLYYLRGLEGKAARIKEDLAAAAAAKAARLATKG